MNFAVIGLGSFGTKRAQSIKKSKLCKLVSIFDPNSENAEKAKKILDTPIVEYKKILTDKNIDVICICAPNKFHEDIIIESLRAILKKLKKYTRWQKIQKIFSKLALIIDFLKAFYLQKS